MLCRATLFSCIRPQHKLCLGLQNLRCLPALETTSCSGKGSQQPPKQPSAALLCQNRTAANKQQRTTPLRQPKEQPGQTAAPQGDPQGGPGQKPAKQQVKQDTLLKELRNLFVWPLHKIWAKSAALVIPQVVEEEFDDLQFLEGCKGAFVAVHESMHSTRDLAPMVSLPLLDFFARSAGVFKKGDRKFRISVRPGSVNPGQPSIVGWALFPRKYVARIWKGRMPMPGIAADDEYQDYPEMDAKGALTSLFTDMIHWPVMAGGSSLMIRVRFSGCSFVLETRDRLTGDLIMETLDQRARTWYFGRGPLPDLTYPVREFEADLPWVLFLID